MSENGCNNTAALTMATYAEPRGASRLVPDRRQGDGDDRALEHKDRCRISTIARKSRRGCRSVVGLSYKYVGKVHSARGFEVDA